MRLFPLGVRLTVVSLSSAVAVPFAGASIPANVQLRGVLFAEGSYRFMLTDERGNSSGWVKLTGSAFGLNLVDFAPATDTLTLKGRSDGPLVTLRLVSAKVLAQPNVSLAPVAKPPNFEAPQLPAAVQAMMFPRGNTPRAPILAHPSEAAPAISPQANLPPEIARHLPTPPIEKSEFFRRSSHSSSDWLIRN